MLDSLQTNLLRLLGREVDPLGSISPDQLKAVLKSIEGKYNSLRDENKRLKGVIDEHAETIDRLRLDLKAARESQTPQGTESLQLQCDELQARLEELQRARTMERAEWEGQRTELEHKLIDIQRLRLGESEQLQELELKHHAELQDLELGLHAELLTLREERDRLEAQVSRQESDTEIRDRLDSEKQTLRARVEELTAERDHLEAKLREAEQQAKAPLPIATGPAVSHPAPPPSATPSESPDRRELLARLIGGGEPTL